MGHEVSMDPAFRDAGHEEHQMERLGAALTPGARGASDVSRQAIVSAEVVPACSTSELAQQEERESRRSLGGGSGDSWLRVILFLALYISLSAVVASLFILGWSHQYIG